jgi:hypothetical protein
LKFRFLQIISSASLLAILTIPGTAMQAQQAKMKSLAVADATIPSAALVQPAELVRMLHGSEKPLILQVGSHALYAEAHIPGSEYVGAAGTSAGLQSLRERVSNLRKDQFIVIYCGCCPWGHCPNIRPAYEQLRALGFTQVKALYLADDFGTD